MKNSFCTCEQSVLLWNERPLQIRLIGCVPSLTLSARLSAYNVAICLSVCLTAWLFAFLSVYPFACHLFVCLQVCHPPACLLGLPAVSLTVRPAVSPVDDSAFTWAETLMWVGVFSQHFAALKVSTQQWLPWDLLLTDCSGRGPVSKRHTQTHADTHRHTHTVAHNTDCSFDGGEDTHWHNAFPSPLTL